MFQRERPAILRERKLSRNFSPDSKDFPDIEDGGSEKSQRRLFPRLSPSRTAISCHIAHILLEELAKINPHIAY